MVVCNGYRFINGFSVASGSDRRFNLLDIFIIEVKIHTFFDTQFRYHHVVFEQILLQPFLDVLF